MKVQPFCQEARILELSFIEKRLIPAPLSNRNQVNMYSIERRIHFLLISYLNQIIPVALNVPKRGLEALEGTRDDRSPTKAFQDIGGGYRQSGEENELVHREEEWIREEEASKRNYHIRSPGVIGPKLEGDERGKSRFHRGGYFDYDLEILQ